MNAAEYALTVKRFRTAANGLVAALSTFLPEIVDAGVDPNMVLEESAIPWRLARIDAQPASSPIEEP